MDIRLFIVLPMKALINKNLVVKNIIFSIERFFSYFRSVHPV